MSTPTLPQPQPPPQYGPSISLEEAKKLAEAAEAEARKNGWYMVIAVVDTAGRLVVLHKMDHTQNGSVLIAQQKAETAANFKRPTKALEDAVAAGGVNLRLLAVHSVMPLEGGLPLLKDGKVVGAIGASGGTSAEDALVAKAGAAAL